MNPYDQALGKSVKKNRNRKKPLNQARRGATICHDPYRGRGKRREQRKTGQKTQFKEFMTEEKALSVYHGKLPPV